MKLGKEENCKRKRKVVNIVELGDSELVYIRLDNGKKYLLNGDGCWRCGSTAKCFGNMDDSELEVICEFDFFDEVRSLSLLLLQNRLTRLLEYVEDGVSDRLSDFLGRLVEVLSRIIEHANIKNIKW